MDQIGIMLGATNIGYTTPSDAEVREALSELSVVEFAPLIGRLSVALQIPTERNDTQRQIAEFLLTPELVGRLFNERTALMNGGLGPIWVTPAHQRIVLKALLEIGNRKGGRGAGDPEGRLKLGLSILAVQSVYRDSFSFGPRPSGSKAALYDFILFKHGATMQFSNMEAVLSHKELVYERIFRDDKLRERFRARYGVDPYDVHRALFALWLAFRSLDADRMRLTYQYAVDYRMVFGRFGVPRAAGEFVLSLICRDLREGVEPNEGSDPALWASDLRFLVSKPLGRLDNAKVCCLDYEFLHSAYARTLFNLTTRLISGDKEPTMIQRVGGEVMEETAYGFFDVLQAERPEPKSKVMKSFGIPGTKLQVDGAVAEDHEAVLFEFKSGLLPMTAVFGRSVDELAAAIDKKFVKEDDGKPYGFTQLARSAEYVLADPSIVGLERIEKLYPVLVVEDDDLPHKPMAMYALTEAKEVLRPLGDKASDPIILHIEDLALLAERCRKYGVPFAMERMWSGGFAGFSFSDLIKGRLPVNDAERVELERPFPITFLALEHAVATSPDWPPILCPICGTVEKDYTSQAGGQVTRCAVCPDAPERLMPADRLLESKEAEARWISEYERS